MTRATELRRAFDLAFAEPTPTRVEFEDLLAIRVGGQPHAVRLADITGVFADRRITPLPDAPPELLGIGSLRGSAVAVYDLRALLGHPGTTALRWSMIARRRMVAFAFDGFGGQLRAPLADIAASADERAAPHVRGMLRTTEMIWPVLDVESLVDLVERRARAGAENKEG
jgi:chemotaxis signal transduction protein